MKIMKNSLFTTTIISLVMSISSLEASVINSITKGGIVNTTASHTFVPEMTILPVSDTNYLSSNTELYSSETFCVTQAVVDLETLYNALMAQPSTTTHGSVFGNPTGGETLRRGVYDVGSVTSITGKLTLDGGGNPNYYY
jgi:hypothetical protein